MQALKPQLLSFPGAWASWVTGPTSDLERLRTLRSWEDVVDRGVAVQRDLREKEAWIAWWHERLRQKASDFLLPRLRQLQFSDADDRYVGMWFNGTSEETVLRYLAASIPCFIVHEFKGLVTGLDDREVRVQENFLQNIPLATLLGDENPYQTIACGQGILDSLPGTDDGRLYRELLASAEDEMRSTSSWLVELSRAWHVDRTNAMALQTTSPLPPTATSAPHEYMVTPSNVVVLDGLDRDISALMFETFSRDRLTRDFRPLCIINAQLGSARSEPSRGYTWDQYGPSSRITPSTTHLVARHDGRSIVPMPLQTASGATETAGESQSMETTQSIIPSAPVLEPSTGGTTSGDAPSLERVERERVTGEEQPANSEGSVPVCVEREQVTEEDPLPRAEGRRGPTIGQAVVTKSDAAIQTDAVRDIQITPRPTTLTSLDLPRIDFEHHRLNHVDAEILSFGATTASHPTEIW
ncbi:hypothetical protein B0H13DRAFT_2366244 [Mycena leptocephala]|nr:hypothetical protein B0H13DRAFT_2366244 [Mycena leptocephala]